MVVYLWKFENHKIEELEHRGEDMTLELITGSMFCGKTEELLRRVRREQVSGKEVVVFKPRIDTRYSFNSVSSHNRSEFPAVAVDTTKDLYDGLTPRIEVIGIDEVQFLDDAVIGFCLEQVEAGRKVIASGLNTDFRGEPFRFRDSDKHIGYLMAHALNTSLRAICVYELPGEVKNGKPARCGADADFNQRLIDGRPAEYDSPLILVGAADSYQARCLKHFERPWKK
jgi:thymidine kinase